MNERLLMVDHYLDVDFIVISEYLFVVHEYSSVLHKIYLYYDSIF